MKSDTSLITKITTATFNTGHPKIEFQFKMSRRDIADYLTRTLESGHEVAMVLLKREEQTIKLPPRINKEDYIQKQKDNGELDDTKMIRLDDISLIAK